MLLQPKRGSCPIDVAFSKVKWKVDLRLLAIQSKTTFAVVQWSYFYDAESLLSFENKCIVLKAYQSFAFDDAPLDNDLLTFRVPSNIREQ